MHDPPEPTGAAARRITQHYEVHEPLGRGGMACVYRATDLRHGREVALKQLVIPEHVKDRASLAALFEREYRVLSQLAHPRVIEVYDYGIEADVGPYYTMELLDGGDLRELAPLPYPRACQLLFDVASSLALLHSRRLLHRDVSPRNVRCTRDGQAKLIDFGAIVTAGASVGQVVGTPVCTPPEALHRLSLDARADLYSLGITLYYALTRVLPYPAQSLNELPQCWAQKPPPPSAYNAEIPPALDDLVLSLMNTEPGLRPRSAFEVMQRLATCAGLPADESSDVSRAYLVTPELVGRDPLRGQLQARLLQASRGRGAALCLMGGAGMGRSRLLDACVLDGKTLGMAALRVGVTSSQPMATALALADLLLEALPLPDLARDFPELFEPPAAYSGETRPAWKQAKDATAEAAFAEGLCRLFGLASKLRPLLLALDDVERIDAPSAALLAQLIDRSKSASLCVVLTADVDNASRPALTALSRRCELQTLPPLTPQESYALFGSVFGDVPNLALLTRELHALAHGVPGLCLALAQHLIDTGKIEYHAGTWKLPAALAAEDLPQHTLDALRLRIDRLPAAARRLAEAQALAFSDHFSAQDYQQLAPELPSGALDQALTDLLGAEVLAYDGQTYTLRNRMWTEALRANLDEASSRERHSALAELYRERSSVACIHHLFAAGRDCEGLDCLLERQKVYARALDVKAVVDEHAARLAGSYAQAIATAERLGRRPRELNELRRWFVAASVITDASYYPLAAPAWFAQLEHDSGLDLWRKDSENPDASARLMNALTGAVARFEALPEAERVYSVQEAVRLLAEYVAFSIVIGSRTMDGALIAALPAVLEPFVPLSPLLEAIWQNAIATYESSCLSRDTARDRWLAVLDKLAAASGAELHILETIQNAVSFAIGLMDAEQGLLSAERWATRIEQDPLQRLSALQLRRIVRMSQGDFQAADRLRREAELWALQARAAQMFQSLIVLEMKAAAFARDLAGVSYALEQIRPWAARYPGWRPNLHEAEGRWHGVRGDYAAAKLSFEQCLALCPLSPTGTSQQWIVWSAAQGGLADAMLQLGDAAGAERVASAALATCERNGIRSRAQELTRVLALAEARQGKFQAACMRLERLIETLTALSVTGLRLGLAYEARADVAILSTDAAGFEHYARLTAQEYRYGAGCPLGTRYERLVNEARRAGLQRAPALAEFAPTEIRDMELTGSRDLRALVMRTFSGVSRIQERAQRALGLLCELTASARGHLFLDSEGEIVARAAHGAQTVPPQLGAAARELVAKTEEQLLTQMLTELGADQPHKPALVEADGMQYELWLLGFVSNAERHTVGVVALGRRERRDLQAELLQILPLLAAQLMDTDRTQVLS